VIAPSDFECVRDGSATMLVRSDCCSWLLPLLRARQSDWAGYQTQALAAGRGGAQLVRADGHDVVVRPYRRGGMAAWVLHDTYFGWHPRPFRELGTLAALRHSGAPVVEVYAAMVQWLAPGCYRGWLVTRYIAGARTLWEWFSTNPPLRQREQVLAQVGRAIRRLHDCGSGHPDLNLNNIVIGTSLEAADPPQVVFIDFDGPRRAPQADVARLARSARKLDPDGTRVTAADLETLRAAYATRSATGAACT
jgi:3-deoxy-D-manno-octulosonic acid kinase